MFFYDVRSSRSVHEVEDEERLMALGGAKAGNQGCVSWTKLDVPTSFVAETEIAEMNGARPDLRPLPDPFTEIVKGISTEKNPPRD
jgi:hypothetical protein